jgi:acetyl-CoA carboxylase biotin carboxyl carrier protein
MPIRPADIEAVVACFEASDWRRIELVADGVELHLSKDPASPLADRPPEPRAEAVSAPAAPPAAAIPGATLVTAPSLGTFYRAPRPGEPPFVTVGDQVREGQDLCIVEVMKLFTTVHAPAAGRIAAIHAEDGDLVEFGQPLVSLLPDG